MARRIGFGWRRRGTVPAAGTRGPIWRARYLFLLIPLTFAVTGGWLLIDAVRFSRVALPAEGTVVSVESHWDSDGTTYTPTVRYTARDGITRDAPTHISASGYDYRTGTRLEILYDPAEPDEVRVHGILSLWALPVGFTLLGAVSFGIALAAMLQSDRDEAGSPPD